MLCTCQIIIFIIVFHSLKNQFCLSLNTLQYIEDQMGFPPLQCPITKFTVFPYNLPETAVFWHFPCIWAHMTPFCAFFLYIWPLMSIFWCFHPFLRPPRPHFENFYLILNLISPYQCSCCLFCLKQPSLMSFVISLSSDSPRLTVSLLSSKPHISFHVF